MQKYAITSSVSETIKQLPQTTTSESNDIKKILYLIVAKLSSICSSQFSTKFNSLDQKAKSLIEDLTECTLTQDQNPKENSFIYTIPIEKMTDLLEFGSSLEEIKDLRVFIEFLSSMLEVLKKCCFIIFYNDTKYEAFQNSFEKLINKLIEIEKSGALAIGVLSFSSDILDIIHEVQQKGGQLQLVKAMKIFFKKNFIDTFSKTLVENNKQLSKSNQSLITPKGVITYIFNWLFCQLHHLHDNLFDQKPVKNILFIVLNYEIKGFNFDYQSHLLRLLKLYGKESSAQIKENCKEILDILLHLKNYCNRISAYFSNKNFSGEYDKNIALRRTAAAGNFDDVKLFLLFDANPTLCSINGYSSFHWAFTRFSECFTLAKEASPQTKNPKTSKLSTKELNPEIEKITVANSIKEQYRNILEYLLEFSIPSFTNDGQEHQFRMKLLEPSTSPPLTHNVQTTQSAFLISQSQEKVAVKPSDEITYLKKIFLHYYSKCGLLKEIILLIQEELKKKPSADQMYALLTSQFNQQTYLHRLLALAPEKDSPKALKDSLKTPKDSLKALKDPLKSPEDVPNSNNSYLFSSYHTASYLLRCTAKNAKTPQDFLNFLSAQNQDGDHCLHLLAKITVSSEVELRSLKYYFYMIIAKAIWKTKNWQDVQTFLEMKNSQNQTPLMLLESLKQDIKEIKILFTKEFFDAQIKECQQFEAKFSQKSTKNMVMEQGVRNITFLQPQASTQQSSTSKNKQEKENSTSEGKLTYPIL